jgi:hypothetical protein
MVMGQAGPLCVPLLRLSLLQLELIGQVVSDKALATYDPSLSKTGPAPAHSRTGKKRQVRRGYMCITYNYLMLGRLHASTCLTASYTCNAKDDGPLAQTQGIWEVMRPVQAHR